MTEEPAEAIANGVLAHPSVVKLDGGPLGVVATHLPGRRVAGVRIADDGGAVEISVVLRLGERLPEVAEEIRRLVRGIAGDASVDVTVVDVVEDRPEPSVSDVK